MDTYNNNFGKLTENGLERDTKEKMNKKIRIYSYNSRGFDQIKQKFCMELMNSTATHFPILCNQENFILKGNAHLIKNALPDCHVIIKPATKIHSEGRPINGMFIAIPTSLRSITRDISPNHNRIQAVLLETDENTMMIVNVYFPADPKTKQYYNDHDLEDLLATIENLIDAHPCQDVIIGGDLNCDFSKHNGRLERLKTFLTTNSMNIACEFFQLDFTHEFEMNDVTYTSAIDHFLWNRNLTRRILCSGVLHSINNTSDHSPIYCDVDKGISLMKKARKENTKYTRVHIKDMNLEDWETYRNTLQVRLERLKPPECADCRDIHCGDQNHHLQIDTYVESIVEAIDISIKSVVGFKRINRINKKISPGWSDLVRPHHENAMFWNAVWKSAGKPLNNSLHNIMKRTRNLYHYAIRKCKRTVEHLKKDKLLNKCMSGNNNIFEEIRKMRKTVDHTPDKIDGYNNSAKRFGDVYQKLYNSTNDKTKTK